MCPISIFPLSRVSVFMPGLINIFLNAVFVIIQRILDLWRKIFLPFYWSSRCVYRGSTVPETNSVRFRFSLFKTIGILPNHSRIRNELLIDTSEQLNINRYFQARRHWVVFGIEVVVSPDHSYDLVRGARWLRGGCCRHVDVFERGISLDCCRYMQQLISWKCFTLIGFGYFLKLCEFWKRCESMPYLEIRNASDSRWPRCFRSLGIVDQWCLYYSVDIREYSREEVSK